MKKSIARHPINWKKLHLKKGKKIIVIDGNKVRKKYDIDAIIKLSDLDFKEIQKEVFWDEKLENLSDKLFRV